MADHKTAIEIGGVEYTIDVSKIPYLLSFVSFEQKTNQPLKFIHGPIPLFDIALRGIESGYRQCFRAIQASLAEHRALCETYDFLGIDILNGQAIQDISKDLRAGRSDYELEYKHYRAVKGDKCKARDAAFKLLYLILLGEFQDDVKDSNKIFNDVLYVVSHSGTFKWRTRSVIRAAYEDRIESTLKQKANLDRWEKDVPADQIEDDGTTEEDSPNDYDSDDWD